MFMEMKSSMTKIPIEGLDEEDSFRVLGGHIFHGLGIQQLQSDGIKRIDRVVSQQLFDRPQFARLDRSTDGMILIPDNDAITI